MRRMGAILVLVLMVVTVGLPAFADHVSDGGVDQTWTNAMNQESYWEDLWNAECAKFEDHSGFIPAEYDAAVIKDGNMVRVYADLTNVGAFTAIGAVNPANGKHFKPDHSWVMKCKFNEDDTTTTTVSEETTTTTGEETTTTVSEETTTTISEETTTTIGSSSTTISTPDPSFEPGHFCADGASWLAVDFEATAFTSIDLYLEDPLGSPDATFTASGELRFGVLTTDTYFTFVGNVVGGGVVSQVLYVPATDCDSDLTTLPTVVPTSITTPVTNPPTDPSTLPFTGLDGSQTVTLVFLGISVLALGAVLVLATRRNDEDSTEPYITF